MDYFPGSTVLIPREPVPLLPALPKGKTVTIRGVDVEVFSIGELSSLLNRRPVTLRKWETEGILPRARIVKPGRAGDVRGKRRLYSRQQVEGILKIAAEEGILNNTKAQIKRTRFTDRVKTLFAELAVK